MGLPKITVPEYTLTVPSTKKEIKYRPFLVKEEKILLIAMESEDETQILAATKNVINNCIYGDINVEDIPIFDMEYIFLNLRSKSKGEQLDLKYVCPNCNTELPMPINIDDIKVQFEDKHTPKIELNDKMGVVMKYPNMMLQSKIEKEDNKINQLFSSILACIDYIYDENTTYSSKDHTKKEMEEFIESLPDEQFQKISKFFETSPKLKHTIKLHCTHKKGKNGKVCNYKKEEVLEGLASFFA